MTFVDSPGLVDGDMNYPFDVDEAIRWLGELVDLIFVFFDPIGQVYNLINKHLRFHLGSPTNDFGKRS